MTLVHFTVPIEPRTKKNSQEIRINKRTGKRYIAQSKQYSKYAAEAALFIPKADKPIDRTVNVQCLFYMGSRRRVDLTNLLEAIDDIMVDCGVLKDDNSNIIAAHDGSRVLYDKDNPRTFVVIEEMDADGV